MIRFRQAAPLIRAALFCFLLGAASARAESLAVVPPLGDALPWSDTPQGVKTTAPLLLNPTTIVPAGTAVRTFYVLPPPDVSDGPKLLSNDAPRDSAYSRPAAGAGDHLSDAAKKSLTDTELAVRVAHQTVWPNVASFRAALALLGSPDIRLVYQAPGTADLGDQAFNPVQGLILIEGDHAVTVCGVVQGSNAARVGFAPGDRIDALNGSPLNGSLATFVDLYAQSGSASTISKPKPYLFRVRHAGSETPAELAIRPPPSLGGSLLDQ